MRLLLGIILVGLTACHSGWEKDPFANDTENVKNGQKQGTKVELNPPLQSVVFVELEPFYELKEGQRVVIKTGYRITHPEFKVVDFKIEDLEENFPGAVFDATTNEITWTPGDDYVPAGAIVFRRPLTISVFVEYKGLVQEVRRTASINVLRGDARAPYIREVVGFDGDIYEGQKRAFTVVVVDEVSPNGPVLSVRKRTFTSADNGTGYVEYDSNGTKDPTDPTIWRFKGSINLTNVPEITKNYQNFYVGFVAHSSFGEASNIYSDDFRVLTKLVRPSFFTGLTDARTFKKGVLNSYTFTVADVKEEGNVSAEFITDCSREPVAGADCSCTNNQFYSTCTIQWVPQAAGDVSFEVEATTKIDNFVLKDEITRTEKVKIKVVE